MMILTPGHLTLPQLRRIARERVTLVLDPASRAVIDAGAKAVADIAAKGEPAYGINTGFGKLASTHTPHLHVALPASAVWRACTFRTTSWSCCNVISCCRTQSVSANRWRRPSCAC